ncbi:hypothetical protein HY251_01775 [bacterium]|nr:hypothetical protein [bacterium]
MGLPEERGEFTRKFDRDIMKDDTAALEELEAQRKRQLQEDEGIEHQFKKLQEILERRSKWLKDRFTGVTEPSALDFRGRRFEFPQKDNVGPGFVEFRAHLTDTGMGITLECYMGLEGKYKKKYDYMNFPKSGIDVERAKKFVENKIFEFAVDYKGA